MLFSQGDVDVIVDLIQALEAQQSLTTAHLPSGAPAASPTVTLAARLAAKKTRARAARERLSQARSALSARCASDDAFFERVRNLGAAWSLQRGYPRDTSVAVSVGAGEELGGSWLRQGGLELGRNRMLLRNGGGGEVCCDCEAAHKPSGEGPGLALGQEAVEESLRRRRQSELWRGVGAAFERAGGDRAWVSLARRAAEQCKARALGASGAGSTSLGELNTLTPLCEDGNTPPPPSPAHARFLGSAAYLAAWRAFVLSALLKHTVDEAAFCAAVVDWMATQGHKWMV